MIKDKSHIKEAVLYGGLKYDADTTALVVENKKYTDIPRDLNIQHTFYPDSLNLRDGAKYLPATKIEAEQIKQALENTRLQPALYMDLRGTEESFKALSGKNISMLHIAINNDKTIISSLRSKLVERILNILNILKEIHMVFFYI